MNFCGAISDYKGIVCMFLFDFDTIFIQDFQTVEFIEFPLINVRDLIFYKYAESVIDKVEEACNFDGTFFGPNHCLALTNVCTWEMQCIEHRLQRCFPSVIPSVRITCNNCWESLP